MEVKTVPQKLTVKNLRARSVLDDPYVAKLFLMWRDTPSGPHLGSISGNVKRIG